MRELRFEGVRIRYGQGRDGLLAVDGVDLEVPAGKIVGLVGESGSGKSTLAKAAVGLNALCGGQILLDGRRLSGGVVDGSRRRPVQMVFQDPQSSLDPRMTVGASIAEAIPRTSLRRNQERAREVERLLELVGLDAARASSYPAQLSGGQRQRVGLARALAADPDVVIADEITSALDVSVQGTVLNLVRDLNRRMRLSMLFISHNLAVVRYVSDFIAVMYLGRVVELGPADDVLERPQHPYTKELLAAVPSPDSHIVERPHDAERAAVADVEPADPHNPPSGCRFHPRCPIGPAVFPERSICADEEPGLEHVNRTACHFAEAPLTRTP